MRIVINLEAIKGDRIPINYQYELSSWIYHVFNTANPEFALWLHNKGYRNDKKSFKLFTFSNLFPEKYSITGDRLHLPRTNTYLYISFYPLEIPEKFITGIFKSQTFSIGDKQSHVIFNVKTIEKLPEPEFKPEMKLRLLSPIHITRHNQFDSKKVDHLHPEHKDFERLLFSNLIEKYHTFNKENINFIIQDYKMEILTKPKSRLVTIKANTPEVTFLKGFLFDFKITAPQELIKIGYYAGFGKANSLGFGCAEVIENINVFCV